MRFFKWNLKLKLKQPASNLRSFLQKFFQSTKVQLAVWISTFIVKARIFSNWCNTKFLRGMEELDQKMDPAEQFVADTTATRAQSASIFSHLALWTAFAFLLIFFIWAKFAILDEVTVGEGKVVPASQVQVIQNLEGGIVKKIFVREGEIVKAGQVLMQLDDTRFDSDYEQSQAKALALEIKIARLSAVIDNKPFKVSEGIMRKAPDLVAHENSLYTSQEAEQKQLEEAHALNKQEYELTKPLVAKGAASDVEVLRLEQAMAESQQKMDSFISNALQDLNTAKGGLLETNAALESYKDRLARTTIRSPVKGIVKQIKINTVGGVSQPGMELMEIVPLEDTLLVEARIKPKDIGFLHIGQPAVVKITAYDFSIYGGLDGKVEEISADSITSTNANQREESYYIARIRTNKNYLLYRNRQLHIMPGMMASVNILTGHKSVLDYLLKPILKARENALRER